MTESIDVNSNSLDYISLFQSKAASPEIIPIKGYGKPGGEKFAAKNQIENYIKSKNFDAEKDASDSTDNVIQLKGNVDENHHIIYGSKKKDNAEIKIGHPKKFENISYGSDDSNDSDNLLSYGNTANYSVMSSFGALAAAVGANGRGVTKNDLITYLQKMTSHSASKTNNTEIIAFLKNLIAQFDSLSGGSEYLTSFTGIKEPQDYSTVTTEQVTPPIDIRV